MSLTLIWGSCKKVFLLHSFPSVAGNLSAAFSVMIAGFFEIHRKHFPSVEQPLLGKVFTVFSMPFLLGSSVRFTWSSWNTGQPRLRVTFLSLHVKTYSVSTQNTPPQMAGNLFNPWKFPMFQDKPIYHSHFFLCLSLLPSSITYRTIINSTSM